MYDYENDERERARKQLRLTWRNDARCKDHGHAWRYMRHVATAEIVAGERIIYARIEVRCLCDPCAWTDVTVDAR